MCGIAGYFDARERGSLRRARAMTDELRHRGPNAAGHLLIDTRDGSTSTVDGDRRFDLALGHRRLSILDLSDAGLQPMSSASGKHWIVFNGEIYNYVELREELRTLGHEFRTGTDTEVLLAAYEQWGQACLERCNGMWAFALWDSAKQELFCARDRFGVKPLYYAYGEDWFVFGSEIKALLAHPRVPRRPNAAIVYDFLSLKLADHTDETFFDGIHALPGAHALVYRPGGTPQLRRFWDVRPALEIDSGPEQDARAIDRFRELFEDAVRIRLRADVPIGTCLSGGVDSSSIVVTANRLMFDELHLPRELVGDRQRTFSACFEDPRIDERPFVDKVIGATGASTYRVFPSGERLWDELPALVAQMDEPFHSTSQYSQYNVMRLVREHGVTVTLDGQGADELLAGYPGYHGVYLATLLRAGKLAASAREAYATWKMSGRGRSAAELLLRTGYGLVPTALSTPIRTALAPRMASRTPEGRSLQVIRPELHARFADRRLGWIEQRAAVMHDLGKKLYDDVFRFSLPSLLRYADRNSMAFSIESRMPLLDYRLAEHIFSLPLSTIMRDGWTKWVFRRAMTGRLPEAVQWRKDKLGFVTPEGMWLDQGKHHLVKTLSEGMVAGEFLDEAAIKSRIEHERSGSGPVFYTDLFRWYIVELWMRHAFSSSRTTWQTSRAC
jgi:asparagine synthase (glutamine-hydrolysing)